MPKNYFTEKELSCPCCGQNKFNPGTLKKFNAMREEAGFGMNMTSGYRCEAYNEANGYTQTHATGQAGDVRCSHKEAFILNDLAPKYGFTGIGSKQKGDTGRRFMHFDDLEEDLSKNRPRPHLWSY